MNTRNIILLISFVCLLISCTDDDSFSLSKSDILTFSSDTISMDTVFSTVPTSTRTFWVYNRAGDGIRCSKIRLVRGNQTGFRINVDGEYLSPSTGYQISNVEIRKNDSIRVFVELTSPESGKTDPQLLEDELVFTLESGVEQKIALNAYTWDANLLKNVYIKNDTTIGNGIKPTVIYGGLTVDSCATLNIASGSTIYFHGDAGINVYGRIISEGTPDKNIILRGDRTDKMFDYLPYDNVSGQWLGIHFYESSYDNKIYYTDIHSTFNGIVCDSSDVSRSKLQLYNSTVHNCQGYGVKSENCLIDMRNCQISNTLNDCVAIYGGCVTIRQCTLAQFYPFDSNRGDALYFSNFSGERYLPLLKMDCLNSIVTGYANDVISGVRMDDETKEFNYRFINSLLRTEKAEDEENIINVIYEDIEDTATVSGEKNFVLVDIDKQRYNFHLKEKSLAVDSANIEYSLPEDRDGKQRDERPDIGCYEFFKENISKNE